jgi:hypothetical protein
MLCSLVQIYERFREEYASISRVKDQTKWANKHAGSSNIACIFAGSRLLFHPEHGGSTFLRKVAKLLPDYTSSFAFVVTDVIISNLTEK